MASRNAPLAIAMRTAGTGTAPERHSQAEHSDDEGDVDATPQADPTGTPAHHHRLVAAAHAIPAIANTVMVCGHMRFAETVQTGVAKPNSAVAIAAAPSGR